MLTTPLWRALIDGDDTMAVVKLAAENQVVYRDALAALPDIDRLVEPAGERGVIEAIAPLKLMWPPKDVPAERLAAEGWWIIFRKALADIPRSALDKAVAEYIRTSEYPVFPIPGKLRALAAPETRRLFRMVARVKMVTKQPAPKPPVSDEERAQVKAQMAELVKDLGGRFRAPAEPKLRPEAERAAAVRESYATVERLEKERAAGGEAPSRPTT